MHSSSHNTIVVYVFSKQDYYRVSLISKDVVVNSDGVTYSVGVFIKLRLQVNNNTISLSFKHLAIQLSGLPCLGQRLTSNINHQLNMSHMISLDDHIIQGSEDVVYSISNKIETKMLYTVTVSVVGSEGVVQVLVVNFSE